MAVGRCFQDGSADGQACHRHDRLIEKEVERIHEMRRRPRDIADAEAEECRPGWRSRPGPRETDTGDTS